MRHLCQEHVDAGSGNPSSKLSPISAPISGGIPGGITQEYPWAITESENRYTAIARTRGPKSLDVYNAVQDLN